MKKWLAMLLACMAVGLVVAGCGGDDDDDGSGNGGGGETQQPAGEGEGGVQESGQESGGGGGAQVGMANIQFEPSEITVAPGDTVTWTNNEAVSHDVQKDSGPGPDFSSGPEGGMGDGDTFKHTFEEAGTYNYICRVHAPGMAGTVVVK
ncbi:MAG: plastocyanin/azurin family copper-binding protein [Thermoleophilaceae bacterium]